MRAGTLENLGEQAGEVGDGAGVDPQSQAAAAQRVRTSLPSDRRRAPPSPGCAEGYARDATEIQNIQIADGDVCRSLSVPIYMVFPRLFTCPTLETTNFRVGKRPAPSPHGRAGKRPADGPPGAWDRHAGLLGSGTAPSTPPPAP